MRRLLLCGQRAPFEIRVAGYETFLRETAFKLPGVTHVRSSVVLKEVKAETRLPLAVPGATPAARRRKAA